jgi:hypothetical protein
MPGWREPHLGYDTMTVTNRVELKRDGTLRWNGFPASEAETERLARQIPTMNPRPFTILEIEDGADCGRVQTVRKLIDRVVRCQDGVLGYPVCGEGKGFLPSGELPIDP